MNKLIKNNSEGWVNKQQITNELHQNSNLNKKVKGRNNQLTFQKVAWVALPVALFMSNFSAIGKIKQKGGIVTKIRN